MKNDTIAALSTPYGRGAVALIRLSGKESLKVFEKIFMSREKLEERRAVYGVVDTGSLKDDVIAILYTSPRSYTGEEVVEIFCHGSTVITESILRALIKNGARYAEKGEFTKRAFENGKLTLTEAEGIIDLIDAQSESAARAAYNLSSGKLKEKTKEIADGIKELTANLNAAIDYPEGNLETDEYGECLSKCRKLIKKAKSLAETYESGKKINDGVNVVIAGKPNVGKSTLLNALVGFERAIVTPQAGTTRDTVESSYVFDGVLFKVTDTAGVRDDYDSEAERMGIERSFNAIKGADIVLILDDSEYETSAPKIFVGTKCDEIKIPDGRFAVSGKTGENITELKKLIYDKAGVNTGGEILLTNLRQFEALTRCAEALNRAAEGLENNVEAELITVDLLEAMSDAGVMDGAAATSEVVDGIFARFCVGK